MAYCLKDSGKIKIDYIQKYLFMTMILTTNNKTAVCILYIRFDWLLKCFCSNNICLYLQVMCCLHIIHIYIYIYVYAVLWFSWNHTILYQVYLKKYQNIGYWRKTIDQRMSGL